MLGTGWSRNIKVRAGYLSFKPMLNDCFRYFCVVRLLHLLSLFSALRLSSRFNTMRTSHFAAIALLGQSGVMLDYPYPTALCRLNIGKDFSSTYI